MDYTELSDEELVQLSVQDQYCFEFLMLRHQKALICFVEKHFMLSRTTAEDIAQEALIQAYFNLQRFDFKGNAKWKTWLYKITVNLAKSWLRKNKNIRMSFELPEMSDAQDYGLVFDKAQIAVKMQKVIALLNPVQQEIIKMYYYQGFSCVQISAQLKIPTHNIKIIMQQALKSLTSLYYQN